METALLIIILVMVVILGLAVVGALVAISKTNARLAEFQSRLPEPGAIDSLSKRLQEVNESSRQSFERLAGSLGELSKATEQMIEVGKTISSLEDLLKPPKLRGGMGEVILEQLLSQILPSEHYETQYSFSTGVVVDAVIHLGDGMVPVDSKFPLDAFRRLSDRVGDDVGRERRAFIRTVKKHIDEIATKYILPDEGTFDFALMFIPAENVYYETIIKDDQGGELFPYAVEKRVIPVSPNSFYAYLQVIVHGLKGLQIEQRAREIMEHLARLQGDEQRFREEFNTLGRHLRNASNKYEDAERRLTRFEDKLAVRTTDQGLMELPSSSGAR